MDIVDCQTESNSQHTKKKIIKLLKEDKDTNVLEKELEQFSKKKYRCLCCY